MWCLKPTKYNGSLTSPIITLDKNDNTKSYLTITKVRQAADDRVMDIALNMPYGTSGIKLIDFIKGVQKKFNLVIYPDKTKQNQFIVETFNNWYNKGRIVSFDNYIDVKKAISVTPANNLAVNKLQFGGKGLYYSPLRQIGSTSEGQEVKAGDLLFTLDDRADKANLDKARALADDATRQYKRANELLEKKFQVSSIIQ